MPCYRIVRSQSFASCWFLALRISQFSSDDHSGCVVLGDVLNATENWPSNFVRVFASVIQHLKRPVLQCDGMMIWISGQ